MHEILRYLTLAHNYWLKSGPKTKGLLFLGIGLFFWLMLTIFEVSQFIAVGIFVLGYLFISLEHVTEINKAAISLVIGSVLWIVAIFHHNEHLIHDLHMAGAEIFDLIVFLLAAMSLVEVLVHYEFFDWLQYQLQRLGFSRRLEFVFVAALAFCLSAVIDNLTATIVMTQISRKLFKGENLLRMVAMIVIAANAGGAFSPIGDVTTIMIWLAGKFEALEIITRGFIPSLTIFIVAVLMMMRGLDVDSKPPQPETISQPDRSEWFVIGMVFVSFSFPIFIGSMGMPPYLGLIFGLGVVWITVELFKQLQPKQTHLDANIEKFIRETDIPSLQFFIGILLAVNALNDMEVLKMLANVLYGDAPSGVRVMVGNTFLGMLSAVLDNVPLTAIALKILPTTQVSLWVMLALSVGTGGSLLVVGSAAGVVAMGMMKELTFTKYIQLAFWPALVSFFAGLIVWYVQYQMFFAGN